MKIRTRKKINLLSEQRGNTDSNEKTENDLRIKYTHDRIESNKEYFNYLKDIMESYVGSAKTFTAISMAIISFSFLKNETVKNIIRNNDNAWWPLILSWVVLGISILSAAVYQYSATELLEDEVEFDGENYNTITRKLNISYIVMVAGLFIGLASTIWFIYGFLIK